MISSIECWLEDQGITPDLIINEEYTYSDLYDDMFVSDSVTGNASGSYTFNRWEAEECLCHNLDLLASALEEFYAGELPPYRLFDPEWCDVTIRCYLLGPCLDAVLRKYECADDVSDMFDFVMTH